MYTHFGVLSHVCRSAEISHRMADHQSYVHPACELHEHIMARIKLVIENAPE
jgi:hypothetical protein